MAPPAASAAARINAGKRAKPRRAPPATRAPRRSIWGVFGVFVGAIFWWLIFWPIRALARGIWSLVSWAFRRPASAAVALALIAGALGSAYWFWFRNSSFVRVEMVRVDGTTTQIDDINAALAAAAAGMTTLNADAGTLADALARFPTVRGVEVRSDFPHGLVVHIDEMPPVALVETGDRVMPVAGDGRLLNGISSSQLNLPTIAADTLPSNGVVTGDVLAQAEVLGAAPLELRPLVEETSTGNTGVTLRMRAGVELRFGTPEDLADKWAAAAAVLADPKLDTASYVDLRIPARPAVGGDPTMASEPTSSDLAGTAPETTTEPTPTSTAAPVTGSTAAEAAPAAEVAPAPDPGTDTASTGAVAP